jgi:3D (Asp-Asp-Asp) domain-containing protein
MNFKHGVIVFSLAFVGYLATPRVYSTAKNPSANEAVAILGDQIKLETTTAFDQRHENEVEPIPFTIEYEDDKDLEYGTEKIVEEGQDGQKEHTYLVTFWRDDIINRQLIKTAITQPKAQKVAIGKKIVWKETTMPDVGKIKYWKKLEVWATKYDANCIGCTGRTYSGTQVKKGVCAVDPKVITMGDYFYVEGYGLCKAEDIGGAIKGNKIDLGFENAKTGNWTTRTTNIYLLTPPKKLD